MPSRALAGVLGARVSWLVRSEAWVVDDTLPAGIAGRRPAYLLAA